MRGLHLLRFLVPMIVAACSAGGGAPNPNAGSGAPVSVGTTSTAQLGTILVGANGMPLYTHAGDSATTSTCTGTCLVAWPALGLSLGQQAVGGPGVSGTFGTLTRTDGTLQATYDGRPLYYARSDARAGDVTGNGVDGFSVATP